MLCVGVGGWEGVCVCMCVVYDGVYHGLEFIFMPGESYRRRLGVFLLCLCYVFRALIISLVC